MCIPKTPIAHFACMVALVLIVSVSAEAYTLVMRDGRHVEISDQFVVTHSTVTWEVSPGIQITVQLRTVDVNATEKMNGEAPGSFLRHSQTLPTAPAASPPLTSQRARRTITNKDLQSTSERRRASEIAYEGRRKELGLPSIAESRRIDAEQSAAFSEQLHQNRANQTEDERYWRGRASDLRVEMAAVDAETDVVRRRLDETRSLNYGNNPFTTVLNPYPYGGVLPRYRGWGYGRRSDVYTQTSSVYGTSGVITRGPYGGYGGPYIGQPGWGQPGWPYANSNYANEISYERSNLLTRLNELTGRRAALNVRWRALEEEARRAGVSPGWLRP
jgi:hypothetical protein